MTQRLEKRMAIHPRTALAEGLDKLKAPSAKKFAGFLRQGDEGGLVPCWGAIAKRFEQDCKGAAEREAVWRELVGIGEKSALLLFVKHNLSHPAMLAKMAEEAAALPVVVQRVLASLDEAHGLLERKLPQLSAEAQQIWAADAETRRAERVRFESRMARLVAVDYIPAAKPAG